MKHPIVKSELDRNWQMYCGFLDLTVNQFMSIQESLLDQQIEKISHSRLGRKIIGREVPRNINEFRRLVPLTRYEDYLPELEKGDEKDLAAKPFFWAETPGRPGFSHRTPVTFEAYRRQLEHLAAVIILACSKSRGSSSASEGDKVLFNVAPKPNLSGILTSGGLDNIHVNSILTEDEQENLEFEERIARGFELSWRKGMDILVAMPEMLVKTAREMDQHPCRKRITRRFAHPGEWFRLNRAIWRRRLENGGCCPGISGR